MLVCPECGLAQEQGSHCPADGTPLSSRGDDLILGITLGAYRIARLLGVGGMGRVYKGVHPGIGSRVAIKVLSYECAQRHDLVERFFAEARAVNMIRHESIVNVLDLATLPDGRPYIIMEYLDGAPLANIVEKAGPLPLGSLARLTAEVLDALGAAHSKGIVHRDLKPDNIYITPAGRPKVLDFGIAKLQVGMGAGSATQTGSLLGTPHYMSPEQAMGKHVDARTDIYALGVILFECATGRRPFNAESLFDLLRKHVDEAPPSPRSLRPDMTPQYEHVILRALDKNAEQRWGSAQELAHALQHATAGMGPEAWTPINPGTASAIAAQRTPASWPSGQQSWPSGGGSTPVPPTAPGGPPGTQPGATPMNMQGPPGHMPGAGQAQTHHLGMVPHASMPHGGMPPQQPPMSMPHGGMPPQQGMHPTGHPPQVPQGMPIPQGTAASPPKSSGGGKGLWIALAVLVLGGAGAAVFFATRGGDSASASAKDEEKGDEGGGGDEVVDPHAVGGAGEPVDPDEADQADDDKQAALDDIDDPDFAELKALEELEKQAEAIEQALGDPDPPVAKVVDRDPSGGSAGGGGGGGPISIDDAAGPLARPAGFDPAAFDVGGYLATAEAEAKRIWPDAKLVRFDANGVRPTGLAELSLSDDFYVRYWFKSAAASKRPADLPVGMKHETTCNLQIWVDQNGIRLMPMSGWDCDEIAIAPPKCSVKQAWDKAIKIGAPSGNAVADVSFMANIVSKQIRWFFTVGDFSEQIPDGGC